MRKVTAISSPFIALAIALAIIGAFALAGQRAARAATVWTPWASPIEHYAAVGNGFEVNPQNAFADEAAGSEQYASNINGVGDAHVYFDFDLDVPKGATINGIEVKLDWKVESTNNSPKLRVQLSGDGGNTWTAAKDTPAGSTSFVTHTLGSSTDDWWPTGSWIQNETLEQLANGNFRVKITAICTSSCPNRDWFLDWVGVRVNYTDGNQLVNPSFTSNLSGWATYAEGGGSVWRDSGGWVVIDADPNLAAGILQNLDTGDAIGRTVNVTGKAYRVSTPSPGNRSFRIAVETMSSDGVWSVPTGCSNTWTYVDLPADQWVSKSLSCSIPSSNVYGVRVRYEVPASTANPPLDGYLGVDDVGVTVTGGSAPSFTVTAVDTTPVTIPASADIVFVSNRHWTGTYTPTPTCYQKEVYAWAVPTGTGTPTADWVQLTFSGYENIHPAISPDRQHLAVVRFLSGQCGGELCDTSDPDNPVLSDYLHSVWMVDLANGKEYQLLPSWYKSGMGGVAWTASGNYLYFGMDDGRHEHIYRIRSDGRGLTKISPNDDWGSDVGMTKDGAQVLYKYAGFPGGQWSNGIWRMDWNGANPTQITTGANDGSPETNLVGCWYEGDYDPEANSAKTKIVFAYHPWTTDPDGVEWDIYMADYSGGTNRTLIAQGGEARLFGIPDWQVGTNLILASEWDNTTPADPYMGCVTFDVTSAPYTYTRIEEAAMDAGLIAPQNGGLYCRFIDNFN